MASINELLEQEFRTLADYNRKMEEDRVRYESWLSTLPTVINVATRTLLRELPDPIFQMLTNVEDHETLCTEIKLSESDYSEPFVRWFETVNSHFYDTRQGLNYPKEITDLFHMQREIHPLVYDIIEKTLVDGLKVEYPQLSGITIIPSINKCRIITIRLYFKNMVTED